MRRFGYVCLRLVTAGYLQTLAFRVLLFLPPAGGDLKRTKRAKRAKPMFARGLCVFASVPASVPPRPAAFSFIRVRRFDRPRPGRAKRAKRTSANRKSKM